MSTGSGPAISTAPSPGTPGNRQPCVAAPRHEEGVRHPRSVHVDPTGRDPNDARDQMEGVRGHGAAGLEEQPGVSELLRPAHRREDRREEALRRSRRRSGMRIAPDLPAGGKSPADVEDLDRNAESPELAGQARGFAHGRDEGSRREEAGSEVEGEARRKGPALARQPRAEPGRAGGSQPEHPLRSLGGAWPESQEIARRRADGARPREDRLRVLLGIGDQPRSGGQRPVQRAFRLRRALVEHPARVRPTEGGREVLRRRDLRAATFRIGQIQQPGVPVALPRIEEDGRRPRGLPEAPQAGARRVAIEEVEGRLTAARPARRGRPQPAFVDSVSHRIAALRSILPAGVRGSAGTARMRRGRAKAGRRFSAYARSASISSGPPRETTRTP